GVMKRMVLIVSVVAVAFVGGARMGTARQSVAANAKEEAASSAEVKIDNFSFGPTSQVVAVGATVTWTNRDDIPHTVVSNDKVFKSKGLDTNDKFSFTFTKAGTYPYFCSLHPKMTGQIVVQ